MCSSESLDPEPAPVEEVLDLTDELQEPQEPPEPVMAAPAPLDDIAFAPIDDAEPIAQPMEEPVDHDDFISDATRGAVGRSLSHLDSLDASRMSVSATPPSGSLDALFTHAVQDAMAPVLQQWVRDNSGDIINQLNPIIREWMDHNLPDLIESAVRREISRRGR